MRRAGIRVTMFVASLVGSLLVAGPAWAAPTTQVVQGDVLRLVSTADWDAASRLLPGQPLQWDVTVSAAAPDPGTVTIGISATGSADLTADVLLCMQEWDAGGCPGGAVQVKTDWQIPRNGVQVPVAEFPDTEIGHLRLAVSLNPGEGGSTQVRVHAQGAGGDSVVVGPDGGLATTGMSPVVPWILGGGAVLLILGGIALIWARRRHRDDDPGGES